MTKPVYAVRRHKSEDIILSINGDDAVTITVLSRDGAVTVEIEEDGSFIELEAPKEVMVEFFAGLINVINNTTGV